jgi:hypothetical protein
MLCVETYFVLVQLQACKQQLKGERLTRDLMTKELRKALAHQKKSARHLSERNAEIAALRSQAHEMQQHALSAHQDLEDKESVVKVRFVSFQSMLCWPCRVCLA